MTQQFDEAFILDGKQTTTSSSPLAQYFQKNPLPSPPSVDAQPFDYSLFSALRRGYKGTWTLLDDKLYLIGLEGPTGDGTMIWEVFPDAGDEGVFADWFTGPLHINQGGIYRYSKPYRHTKHQMEIVLEVVAGLVTHRSIVYNEPPPPVEPPPPQKWWQKMRFFQS